MRQAINPKVRFEVFKRDQHQCRYCGHGPPDVKLEVDHVIPVAEGGRNDIDNLVTACAACNRGKGATSLEVVQPATDDVVQHWVAHLSRAFDYPADPVSVSTFLARLPKKRIERARFLARYHRNSPRSGEGAWRYFCGICWRFIKEQKAA